MRKIHINSDKFVLLVSVIMYLSTFLTLGFTSLPQYFVDSLFVNSDSVFYSYMFLDLFILDKSVFDWILPHSPSIFPDFLVFVPVRVLLGQSLPVVNLVTSSFTLLLLEAVTVFIIHRFLKLDRKGLASFIMVLGVFNVLMTYSGFAFLYFLYMVPHFHVGVLINTLLAFYLYYVLLGEQGSGPSTNNAISIAFFVLCVLAVFSDPLFVPYFVVPICSVNLVLYLFGKVSLKLTTWLTLLIWAAVSFGIVIYTLAPITSVSPSSSNLELKRSGMQYFVIGWYQDYIPVFFPLLPILLLAIPMLWQVFRKPCVFKDSVVSWYVPLSIFFLFLGCLATFIIFGEGTLIGLRFASPVFYTIIVLGIYSTSRFLVGTKRFLGLWLFMVILLIFRFLYYQSDVRSLGSDDYELLGCVSDNVDLEENEYVAGDFWYVNKLYALSDGLLNVRDARIKEGEMYITQTFGYKHIDPGARIRNVLVGKYLSWEETVDTLGLPQQVYTCPKGAYLLKYRENLPFRIEQDNKD